MLEQTTWSPAFTSVEIAVIAAMPDAKARAPAPPSSTARFSSSAERVGFCVRPYSYPLCLPSPSWTYVDVW
jgi:hypothetical protein